MVGVLQPANLVAASLRHGNKPSGIDDFQHFNPRGCEDCQRRGLRGVSMSKQLLHREVWLETGLSLHYLRIIGRISTNILMIACCSNWVSVPEKRCQISPRGENCKVQLLGLTALGHSWSRSVRVCLLVCVCVCVCVCVGVDVGVCVADMPVQGCITYPVGHIR